GPNKAPWADFVTKTVPLMAAKDGVVRIIRGVNPYEWDPGLYNQWAFNPDDGKVYAYFFDATLTLDPKTGVWTDLKIPRFNQCRDYFRLIYGTLAYDPVNKEIVSIGGTSDEDGGTPGTWTFSPGGKEWKKLSPGSKELKELNAEARAAHTSAAAFVNACRNRYHVTESEAEAKKDLAAGANEVAAALEKLGAKLGAAKLSGLEANVPKAALAALEKAGAGFKAMAGKVGGKIASETMVEGQALVEAVDLAERALDTEPCGRGASQAVTCHGKDKVVLFGGCRLDGYLADTWVYDCKTRTWEQRWPKVAPAPRAGHVMAWLPKSKKVVLYGAIPFGSGYGSPHGNAPAPQDLWTYDVDANEWKLLAGPSKDGPVEAFGAADSSDAFVVMGVEKYTGRVTCGMRVDPGAADAGSDKAGVAPGSAKIVFDTPADYDRVAKPDPEAIAKLFKEMPANQWTVMPKPPKNPNGHPWGTTPYDTLRHQWLSFGGGHSVCHLTDVAHYSLRTATWSQGYGEEFPYQNASFSAFFNQTFRNRPTVPIHLWDGAAFDQVSSKVVFCMRGGTWVYDPASREWEYPPVWQNGGGTKVNMCSTPKGVVYWDAGGNLHLYDVKGRAWSKLPLKGARLPMAYGDTAGICYDSKRDCLWASNGGNPMYRYDMKSGELAVDSSPGSPVGLYMRSPAYIPELDMVLSSGRQNGPNGEVGNLAYDIEGKKWVGLVLPCSDGKPRIEKDFPHNSSVAYDPKLKLALFYSGEQWILAARLEKAGLKTFEPAMVGAGKK
ncbi:MAG TPA: kelch repeat-containing protein, partial [Planctomycetota bacterium]|nr:kelch repeat-containing protein [Planctomycetota bacterium]